MSAETKLSALVDGALRAHCLRAIYDLKVNDILNKNGGFMSTGEIISEMEGKCVNPDVLGRLMRYMARFDLFDEKYEGSKFYFKTTEMLQFQESIELIDRIEVSFKIMDLLTDNTDGKTLYEHTKGIKFWDYLLDNNNKRYKANFQALMLSISNRIIPFVPQITEEIKLQGKENSVIVDVGGLSGQMLQLFHKQLPDLKCINLDLPHVIEKVKPIENIKMVGGDMFKVDTLPQCGVIFTKHILHNWSDQKCVEILKNFHAALDEDGIVFNVSFHLAEPGESNDEWENFAMDMTMLYQFGEAKERTVTEYRDMHNKAGFEVIKAVKLGPTEKPHILIIASKK